MGGGSTELPIFGNTTDQMAKSTKEKQSDADMKC